MKTIDKIYAASLEVKKSKFHSFLIPFSSFEETLNDLKKRHPKANHFVTAFRYLNKENQIVEGSSDDGEPRGSSGRPTLKVLQGHNLINVGIITIRYFGGILLGVGGLVRAYSDVANLVISKADLIDYSPVFEYSFEVDYNKTREVEYFIKKNEIFVVDRKFSGEGIEYILRDSIEKINLIKEIL
ncbi:YigZ family protein [Caminibacter mediatlanticus TB-2]|uniref:YigZ family protein n=1 Tax=Caminibacter mediatlanticus TB-2 TaxID=391592 RepID=A0ABX5V820_9BACT|nr:YigZ family protein [Caminibacter mediatlanticus]QCT94430.1 YigZ family protein [Caminibacter mediatlanticus TB-2]